MDDQAQPILEMDVSNAVEPVLLPVGNYNLRIDFVKYKKEQNNISVGLTVLDPPEELADKPIKMLFHTIWLPKAEDDPGQVANTKLQAKRFLLAFDLPLKDWDLSQWKGRKAAGSVNVKANNNSDYPPENVVKAWTGAVRQTTDAATNGDI